MRVSTVLAVAVVLSALEALGSIPAQAFGSDPFVAPEGRDLALGARVRGDRGDCTGQSTMCDDPYAYSYVRRAWYPGYNSGYWVPAEQMRNRYHYSYTGPKYRYHPAWGVDRDGHQQPVYDHDAAPMK